MRLKTVHKELTEILELLKKARTKEEYLRAVKKLLGLKEKIEAELLKEEKPKENGKKLQHLMGWYKSLWNGKPPEYLKFSNPDAIIGKHLKELIQIYERNGEDIEALKKEYEQFLKTWKRGNKGILHFRSALPEIKQTKTEWGETRGREYYKKLWDEGDELPW